MADIPLRHIAASPETQQRIREQLALGTAATADSDDFATAEQGVLAESAVQPDALAAAVSGKLDASAYTAADVRTKIADDPAAARLAAGAAAATNAALSGTTALSGTLRIENANPRIDFSDTDATAGTRFWSINASNGTFGIQKRADDGSFLANLFAIDHATGGAVFNAGATFTSRPTVGGVGVALQSELAGSQYKGTWNASTNTPTITAGTGTNGDYYIVSVAGTQSITGASVAFSVGDQVRFNGTAWQRIPSFSAVTSVAGKTGAVTLNATDIAGLGTAATSAASAFATAAQGQYADKLAGSIVVPSLPGDWNGTTGTDVRAIIQAALDTGKTVIIPPGKHAYKGTLYHTMPLQEVWCLGELYWMGRADNNEAFPMVIATATAVGSRWKGGKLDHRGQQWTSATSGPAHANVALESCFIIMADEYIAEPAEVHNGFDNGIGITLSALDDTGSFTPGHPRYVKVRGVHTYNCGVGIRTHDPTIGPHQAGSGVNVLSGGQAIVEDCTDYGSRTGFIADYAGGASGMCVGFISYGAKCSISGTISFDGVANQQIGGMGIYCGAREFQIISPMIFEPEGVGIWVDGYSYNVTVSDALVKGARRQGFYIQGSNVLVSNPRAVSSSYLNTGVYEAIKVAATADAGGGSFGDSVEILICNPQTEGIYHNYGLRIVSRNGKKAYGKSVGGSLSGVTGPVDNQQSPDFSVQAYRERGGNGVEISDGRQAFRRDNASYLTAPFGDFQNNGNLFLAALSAPSKRLAMGYDPVNDAAVVQAIHAGVGPKPLLLNPSGGDVRAGLSGGWNSGHLLIGTYHLWVDTSGRVRIKNGAPSSATDGTVVGTQS